MLMAQALTVVVSTLQRTGLCDWFCFMAFGHFDALNSERAQKMCNLRNNVIWRNVTGDYAMLSCSCC